MILLQIIILIKLLSIKSTVNNFIKKSTDRALLKNIKNQTKYSFDDSNSISFSQKIYLTMIRL